MVQCQVGTTVAEFIIDTGSKVTLMKESVLRNLKGGAPFSLSEAHAHTELIGITGKPLKTSGCFDVPFKIGTTTFQHPCFACADDVMLPVAGIFGQDVVRKYGIDILASEGILRIGGQSVPILNWRKDDDHPALSDVPSTESVRSPVFLTRECVIPPMSETMALARVKHLISISGDGVVEMREIGTHGLLGADVAVRINSDGEVPVRMANLTLQELRVAKNQLVGDFISIVNEGSTGEPVLRCSAQAREGWRPTEQFDLDHLQEEEKTSVLDLLTKYKSAFSLHKLDLGRCDVIKHRVPTLADAPVYRRAYRIPYAKREDMEQQVKEMLEKDIIEHSTSPWGAPALLVQKADGSFRFVIDYRDLNKVTRVDPYPLPNIEETLALLGSAHYFSVVDMAAGYWQIEMEPSDKEKTAFNTPSGHYQWKRMPMGLVNSSAIFQRTADAILAGILGKTCYVYLDDIIIFSQSFDQHLKDIETVLRRLQAAGLKLKPSKCQFLKQEVKYLGHILSKNGVRPDPEKTRCVNEFPRPTTVKEVRQFLGLIGYYRRHIPEFAEKAKPLTALTSKKVTFSWSTEAEAAFEVLKHELTQAPLLRFPDFSKPFILITDASQSALGAVLTQEFEGNEHPIAYASRKLNPAEQKYAATEQECLAVVWAVKQFRCYLYGRKFKVLTDCRALKWLMNARDPSSRLSRWNLLLQEYNFEVEHRAGKMNQNADALSRAVVREVIQYEPHCDVDRFVGAQREDRKLITLISKCEEQPDKTFGCYVIDSRGLLCRREQTTLKQDRLVKNRIVVPESLKNYVIQLYHDTPYSGHRGTGKTSERVREKYFWHGMQKKVQNYCAQCVSCIRHKASHNRRRAPLQVFEEVAHPFQRAGMDIVGPFPTTTEGNRYLLVFVDHLTKYSEVVAMPDQKAETVAKKFVELVILRHGVPQQILTDQGPNFTSRLFQDVCTLLRIRKLQTTAYHPQCNGAVERLNQTLVSMLSHYVRADQKDWDQWIPYCMFAYNTAKHESTDETPFYLLYGRNADLPDLLYEPPPVNYDTPQNYCHELRHRLTMAHETA